MPLAALRFIGTDPDDVGDGNRSGAHPVNRTALTSAVIHRADRGAFYLAKDAAWLIGLMLSGRQRGRHFDD